MDDKNNIINIFFQVIRNTSLCFTCSEYTTIVNYVSENPYFSAKCLTEHNISGKLDSYHKSVLLINADIEMLLAHEYFKHCDVSHIYTILCKYDNKNIIEKIIKQLDKVNIKKLKLIIDNNELDKDKSNYINSLLTYKTIID